MSLFCRHNRFVAECPICSKGTVLDPNRKPERRPRAPQVRRPGAKRPVQAASGVRISRGEFAAAGPYDNGREVRLEKVPGGLRLASWHAGQLVKEAPVLAVEDLPGMLSSAAEQGLLPTAELPDGPGGDAAAASAPTALVPAARASSATSCASSASTTSASASRAGSCAPTGAGSSRRRRCFCRRSASSEHWGRRPSAASSCQAIRWSSDYLRVPLKLVTGPANAAKAGEVLGGLRNRLDEDPILVVPTLADVEHAQRELAGRGAVFGARVMRFKWLFEEIAERAGFDARMASDFQRELLVEEAVQRASLDVLADSAAQPGFVRAGAHFFAELGRVRSSMSAARFTRALRDWAGDGPRRGYAEEVAALYRGYRDSLERAGLLDEELFAGGALAALDGIAPERGGPEAAWDRTPVFVYGFDDFDGSSSTRCGFSPTVAAPM